MNEPALRDHDEAIPPRAQLSSARLRAHRGELIRRLDMIRPGARTLDRLPSGREGDSLDRRQPLVRVDGDSGTYPRLNDGKKD
jgi:hypothetical protein